MRTTVPAPFSALFEMLPRLPLELAESVRNGADPISVYSAVLGAMQRRPIVLVLDDLQWADATTAGLARYVGRRLDGTPSTLLCAFRNDELDPSREAADALAEIDTSQHTDRPLSPQRARNRHPGESPGARSFD